MRKRSKVHTFDPEKSHLSAELKAKFLQNCTMDSSIKSVPGVGLVTAARLTDRQIFTVRDFLSAASSFQDTKELVGNVNTHRIYDALLAFRDTNKITTRKNNAEMSAKISTKMSAKISPKTSAKTSTKMSTIRTDQLTKDLEYLGLVDNAKDQALEHEITACVSV